MPDTPALPPLPDLDYIQALPSIPGSLAQTAKDLATHVRALQAGNERLLAIIDRAGRAISAAIEQTQAEYANYDTRAERYYLKVEAWREEARAALAASRRDG